VGTLLTVALLGSAATFVISVPFANRAHERTGLAPVRRALGEGDVAEARRLYEEARPGFRHLWFDPEGRAARDRWDGVFAHHLHTIRVEQFSPWVDVGSIMPKSWSPDGRRLCLEKAIMDLETGEEVELRSPSWRISAEWAPDGAFLSSWVEDRGQLGDGAKWEAATGRIQRVPQGYIDALDRASGGRVRGS
jgi:hypothetical protein